MKFNLKAIPIPVAIAGAVLITGSCALAATHVIHSSVVAKHTAGHSSAVATTEAGKTSPQPTATPSITPTPSSNKTVTPTPAPTTAARYLDVQTGACKGIHAADDGCVTKNMAAFQIASVILWPQNATCNGSSVTVNFNPLIATRYYLAGGGGNAVIQVDYSDGASSPVTLTFTAGGVNTQSYAGLSHTFNPGITPRYQVRVTSPNPITQGWMPITAPCIGPSPSPTP